MHERDMKCYALTTKDCGFALVLDTTAQSSTYTRGSQNVYVCTYIHTPAYILQRKADHAHEAARICMYVCMNVCVRMYVCISFTYSIHTYYSKAFHLHEAASLCILHIHTYIHTYTHTRLHEHAYVHNVHVYTHTRSAVKILMRTNTFSTCL